MCRCKIHLACRSITDVSNIFQDVSFPDTTLSPDWIDVVLGNSSEFNHDLKYIKAFLLCILMSGSLLTTVPPVSMQRCTNLASVERTISFRG